MSPTPSPNSRAAFSMLIGSMVIASPAHSQGFDIGGILGGIARDAIQNGLKQPPAEFDPRRLDRRTPSRPAPLSQVQPLSGERGPIVYQSDGITLDQPLAQMPASHSLECNNSEKHPGMRLCTNDTGSSILSVIANNKTGNVAYFSRYQDHLRLVASGIQNKVAYLSRVYGSPHVVDEITKSGQYAVVVTWGSIQISKSDPTLIRNNDSSIYLQLPHNIVSESEGIKTYRLSGGSGFYFMGSSTEHSFATIRYGAYSGAAFNGNPSSESRTVDQRHDPGSQNEAPETLANENATDPLMGEWIGKATCEGRQRDLALNVNLAPSPNFGATIAFFDDAALANPVPHFEMIARKEGSPTLYRFVPSHPYDKLAFTANLASNSADLNISSNLCGAFTLTRPITRPIPSITKTLPSRVQYRESDSLADRCKAISGWAGRLLKEYPGTDLAHTAMEKLFPKAVMLFSDYDFLPAFGFRYDPANLAGEYPFGAIGHDIMRGCGDDPFIRQDGSEFWGNSLFQSTFPSKFTPFSIYDSGSFSISAIKHFVQIARSTQIYIANNISLHTKNSKDEIDHLLKIKSYAEDHKIYLWPSDLDQVVSKITKYVQNIAVFEETLELNQLRAERDPVKGLKVARAFFTGPTSILSDNLSSTDKAQMTKEIDDVSHRFSVALFAPFQKQIDSVSIDLTGVREIKNIMKNAQPVTSQLPEQEYHHITVSVEQKSDQILSPLMISEVNELSSYQANREGLRSQCGWYSNYISKYADFTDTDPFKDTLRKFETIRAERIVAALGNARDAISKVGIDQDEKRRILKDYLCWPSDHKLPESIDYDFLAADNSVNFLQ